MEIGSVALTGIMWLFGIGALCGVVAISLKKISDAIGKLITFLIAVMTAIFWTLIGAGIVYALVKVV